MSLPANIRVNVRQPFPARVQGSGPITVSKVNGVWTIGASYTQLSQLIAGNDLPGTLLAVFDPVTQQFNQITASSLVQGLSGSTIVSVTSAKTILLSDGSTRNVLSGNTFFAVNLQFANTYPSGFWVDITNADVYQGLGTGRAKVINISGTPAWMLYPGMTVRASVLPNGSWQFDGPLRWRPTINSVNFYLDYNAGTDVFGATDGLAPGASAFKSTFNGSYLVARLLDFDPGVTQTRVTMNMAAATTDPSGLHLAFHDLVGAGGGSAYVFSGATVAVTGAANNGSGAIRLTISPSTSQMATNEICSVYGVGGTTEANNTWKITVIDGTHIDLQNSTFTHAFTSSGTITNGSAIITTAANTDAIALYFGTVVQFQNLLIGSATGGNGIAAYWESKCYLLQGMAFYNCGAAQIFVTDNAYVEADNIIGIAGQSNEHVVTTVGGAFQNAAGASVMPGAGFNFSGAFVECAGGTLDYSGAITTTGATVAGIRWTVSGFGNLISATGNFNTDFPGNSNGTGSFVLPDGSTWTQNGPQLAKNITGPANDKIVTQTINSNNPTFTYNSSATAGLQIATNNSSTVAGPLYFVNSSAAQAGSVSWGAGQTSVVYNTTSDEKLKNVDVPVQDWGKIIDAIWCDSFEWKGAAGEYYCGVIAQQIHTVLPHYVHRPKKAIKEFVVDANGAPALDEAGQPKVVYHFSDEFDDAQPWGVDYGRLAGLALWAAKDLRKRVAALEAQLASLIKAKN